MQRTLSNRRPRRPEIKPGDQVILRRYEVVLYLSAENTVLETVVLRYHHKDETIPPRDSAAAKREAVKVAKRRQHLEPQVAVTTAISRCNREWMSVAGEKKSDTASLMRSGTSACY